ncbi:MAG TPA: transglutaminase domain-containing protein [Terriglobia bacterium]|nr:transglutaminase domain-containing protein [Terriglobia bacterium]
MKPRPSLILMLLLTFPVLHLTAEPPEKASGQSRTFEFTYSFTLKSLPATARRVRVWIPLASSDRNQKVVVKKILSPVATHATRTALGDRILYAEIHQPKQPTATFSVVYKVTRHEYSKGDFAELMRYNNDPNRPPVALARFLRPDRLIPVDGKLKTLSDENTKGKQGTVEKARALYDYVFKTMRYDKSGTGWGRGDAVWACDARHGNCTDFHSVFIAMARAAGIPAKFEIGFPLPENAREGPIPGYHCWAEFYVDGPGWVPVDISEAWKNPAKHDYFFGTLDANRVQFSVGRDLILSPKQDGPPVNYFVYPYVEVDGKPYQALQDKFAFRELDATRSVAARRRPDGTRGTGR